MKENTQLEPGLIRTYRLLTWVLVGTTALQAVSIYMRMGSAYTAIYPRWIFPLSNLMILGLLYWPWLLKKASKFFVPLFVVLITVSNLLNTYLISLTSFLPNMTISIIVEGNQNLTTPFEISELNLITASWQLIPLLFIPLIMVAWQYNFKSVIGYVVGSTLMDIIVFITIPNESGVLISFISVAGILMTRTITFLVVGFLVTRMMAAQRQQRRELRHNNQRLLGYTMTLEQLTTSRERNRLARELHDTLAHTLSGLAVQLGAIKALWERDESKAQEKLDEAIDATRSGLNETRRALQALRAEPLEAMGLGLAIEELARSAASRCGATLSLEIDEITNEIPPDFGQAFYRAAQEGLENIVRYSDASHILLKLDISDDTLTMQIKDDGIGFDPEGVCADDFGLRGIKERAEFLNGNFIIDSHPGRGTTLLFSAEVPSHD